MHIINALLLFVELNYDNKQITGVQVTQYCEGIHIIGSFWGTRIGVRMHHTLLNYRLVFFCSSALIFFFPHVQFFH